MRMDTLTTRALFKTRRAFRLTLRAIALIVGLAGAYLTNMLLELHEFGYGLLPYSLVLATTVLELVLADYFADNAFPIETEKKLQRMEHKLGSQVITTIQHRLREVMAEFKNCDVDRMSATVHVIVELTGTAEHRSRLGLLQLTDYVGVAQGVKGRITLINQGIIGRCARTHEMETVDFASAEEYAESMVREFGFTRLEAAKHTKGARSYLAYPLLRDDQLVGTLYFFTSEPQAFPHAADRSRLHELSKEIVRYLTIADLT